MRLLKVAVKDTMRPSTHSQPVRLNADILAHVLQFSSRSTLCSAARVSHDMSRVAIPLLYEHLHIGRDLPSPSSLSLPNCTRNFRHIRSIYVAPHRPGNCARIPFPLDMPNLDSARFHIDRYTYHGPSCCGVLHSLNASPSEITISGERDADVL